MNGSTVTIAGKLYLVTHPALWQACRTEDEYFATLRERQKKGGDYNPLIIQETVDDQQVPVFLF